MEAISHIEKYLLKDSRFNFKQREKIIDILQNQKLNILIVGATGAGKSSTINALFNMDKAKVGLSADPETAEILKFDLGNLVLWDSPGLGDGKGEDESHIKIITNKLNEKTAEGDALIDLVLVILDGSTRDMGTSFNLINDTVIPNLGDNPNKRIIVAMNQADLAYKGRGGWNYIENEPTDVSLTFLNDKLISIENRIKESTGVTIKPIYYCAGYQTNDDVKNNSQPPFNLSKLLWLIVNNTPKQKRLLYRDNKLSKDKDNWEANDNKKDYKKEIKSSLGIGAIIEGVIGFFGGLFGGLFS